LPKSTPLTIHDFNGNRIGMIGYNENGELDFRSGAGNVRIRNEKRFRRFKNSLISLRLTACSPKNCRNERSPIGCLLDKPIGRFCFRLRYYFAFSLFILFGLESCPLIDASRH
jgi:hypothetical protein